MFLALHALVMERYVTTIAQVGWAVVMGRKTMQKTVMMEIRKTETGAQPAVCSVEMEWSITGKSVMAPMVVMQTANRGLARKICVTLCRHQIPMLIQVPNRLRIPLRGVVIVEVMPAGGVVVRIIVPQKV